MALRDRPRMADCVAEASGAPWRTRPGPRRCWPSWPSAHGSVIWDGVSQTQPFADLVGSPGLPGETLLLGGFLVLLVWLVLRVASRVGMAAMGAGLVPVATGYLVAHYLGYLLVEGQRIVVALSDPLQQGWDLLGTAAWEPRDDWLATSMLWTIQVAAVVLGHVTGAWLGHSAVRRERQDGKSRQPVAPGGADDRADRAGPLVAGPEPRLRLGDRTDGDLLASRSRRVSEPKSRHSRAAPGDEPPSTVSYASPSRSTRP